jgi:Sec-independent protein secretion pathway component TatC
MIFIFVALARFLLSSSFLQSKRMGGSLISKVLSIIVIICLLFWVGFLLVFLFAIPLTFQSCYIMGDYP